MTVSAQEACEEVLHSVLLNASALWGVRVYASTIVGSQKLRPYVQFFPAADITPRSNPYHKKAELTYTIKGVGESNANALAIREAITTLLYDSGSQDLTPRLPYHAGWVITNVSEERAMWQEELSTDGKMIFHAGHQYRVQMERR